MNWIARMKSSFGSPFLLLVCCVYWTQGFRSLPWTAISYQLKDELKLSPSASQFFLTVTFMPWSIKPLYGILSDCLPIKGSRRISYLIISGILSFLTWLSLGLFQPLRKSVFLMTGLLVLQNIGTAMADVVVDAMIAEAARKERSEFAGDLQSMSWFAMALGGMFGSVLGGIALSTIDVKGIFLVFTFFPLLQLATCSFVDEKSLISEEVGYTKEHSKENYLVDYSKKSDRKEEFKPAGYQIRQKLRGSTQKNISEKINDLGEFQFGVLAHEDGDWVEVQPNKYHEPGVNDNHDFHQGETEADGSVVTDSRQLRDFGSWNGAQTNDKSSLIGLWDDSHVKARQDPFLSLSSRLKETFQILLQTLKQPAIRQPMLWFFMAQMTVPSLSTIMFYYQTNHLLLDASFLGTSRLVGWGALLLGTFIYNRYLKRIKLRRIFWWTHIALAVITLFDVFLVSGLNRVLAIPNKVFVLGASALGDAVNQFKIMPFLVLSGRLCKPGIEGTLFALFMSLNNFGSTLSSFLGAGLASALGISSDRFENLSMGVCVQALCTIFPIFFLHLIPEGTGVDAKKSD